MVTDKLEQTSRNIHSSKKKVFSTRVSEDLLQRFKEECERYELKESDVVRDLIALFIKIKGE